VRQTPCTPWRKSYPDRWPALVDGSRSRTATCGGALKYMNSYSPQKRSGAGADRMFEGVKRRGGSRRAKTWPDGHDADARAEPLRSCYQDFQPQRAGRRPQAALEEVGGSKKKEEKRRRRNSPKGGGAFFHPSPAGRGVRG